MAYSTENMSALGALGVISGVVLKNSMEQKGEGGGGVSKTGMLLFLVGWALVAYSISTAQGGSYLPYVAAILIIISVMMMKAAMKGNNNDNNKDMKMKVFAGGFILGWLLLAYSITTGQGTAFLAALLVFASMMYFLPKQREQGIVDGPGQALFVIAWLLIIIANSTSLQEAVGIGFGGSTGVTSATYW